MDSAHKKWLFIAISVLVFSSYMGLATTFRYAQMSVSVPLMLIVMMPIGEWVDARIALYRKVTTVITAIFGCMLPFIGVNLGLMDTVIALFMYIQIYSMLHKKTSLEYYHIILMSFFLLVAALVMSPSASMAFVMFFFILSAAASLLLTDWHRQVTNAKRVNPDRRAAAAQLAQSAHQKPSLRIVPITALLGVLVMVVTSVLFVFMPRTGAGILGRSVQTEVYTTGLDDEVSLDVSEPAGNNSSPVMRVRFPDLPGGRYPGELYWRSTTMDTYTGDRWIRKGLNTRVRIRSTSPGRLSGFRTAPVFTRRTSGVVRHVQSEEWPLVEYEIFVGSYPEGGFPLLNTVERVAPKDSSKNLHLYWEGGGDFTVSLNYRGELQPYFNAQSQVVSPSPEVLRASGEDYMNVMDPGDFRLLTEHILQDRTINLVAGIVEEADTAYDKVIAIEQYFQRSAGFTYSRQIPDLDEEFSVDSFIHDVQVGHCELYASAMALMVRSQGIPARVVSGYRGGGWDQADQSYTVTMNMAHLWVEVYFPDVGWITFDPTPAGEEIESTMREKFTNMMARYSLKLRVLWLRYIVGFSPMDTFTVFQDTAYAFVNNLFGDNEAEETIGELQWPGGIRGFILGLVMTGTAVLFVGSVYTLIQRLRRTRRAVLTVDQEKARKLYVGLKAKLVRTGFVPPNATAEELSDSLASLPRDVRQVLHRFIDRYHDVRFGLRPMTVEEHDEFKTFVRQLDFDSQTD